MSVVVRFSERSFRARAQARPLWLDEALGTGPPARPAPLPAAVDLCIVGGGFTGLWTAIEAKRLDPSASVAIVEAARCGSGASGRNGGFVMTAWSKFPTLQKVCGTEGALQWARACEGAVGEIGAFCEHHGIDAHFHQGGWLWAATNRSQVDAWERTAEAIAAAGATPFEFLAPDEVRRRSGSPVHLAGVYESTPATVQPALLAQGLARVARELGVVVAEYAPMTELSADPVPVVTTARGTLRADRVVLATGAWSAAVPRVRRALVVIGSDVVATEPAPERLAELGWPLGMAISDSRRLVNYYRQTDDGRIVFGKGGGSVAMSGRVGPAFDRPSPRADEVTAQLRRIYPVLWDVATARSWRGPVDYSATGLPFFCALEDHPRVLVGAGFSGNGVGPSFLAGRTLGAMGLGLESEVAPEAMRRPPRGALPPEPARKLGAMVVRAAVAHKERAEDLDRPVGRLTALAAGLDPTTFVDR